MQRSHAMLRRTWAGFLAVMLILSVGVVTGLVQPAPSIAESREIIVTAHADASVFGLFPRRNFGAKPARVPI